MNIQVIDSLKKELLGGAIDVVEIKDTATGRIHRLLLRTEPATDIIKDTDKEDYEVKFIATHVQLCTELVHHNFTGPFALEIPLTTLYDCIEIYRTLAYELLKNDIALKLHIVMTDDMPQFSAESLLAEMGELVALGVELIIDNISSYDHLKVAEMILSVTEEIRMDLTSKNLLGHIHLSALISSDLAKDKKVGVIINLANDLPSFSSTYQQV